jgi:hypothetical protein
MMTEIPLIRKGSGIKLTEISILLDKASKGKCYYDRNTTMTEILLFCIAPLLVGVPRAAVTIYLYYYTQGGFTVSLSWIDLGLTKIGLRFGENIICDLSCDTSHMKKTSGQDDSPAWSHM